MFSRVAVGVASGRCRARDAACRSVLAVVQPAQSHTTLSFASSSSARPITGVRVPRAAILAVVHHRSLCSSPAVAHSPRTHNQHTHNTHASSTPATPSSSSSAPPSSSHALNKEQVELATGAFQSLPPSSPSAPSAPTSTSELLDARTQPSLYSTSYLMPHMPYSAEYINVQQTHRQKKTVVDHLAYYTIKAMRFNFDWMSGWSSDKPKTVQAAINRVVFLETVAAVPGSIAGMLRHLMSLRRMRRDGGWIHTLMQEAENERMHLLTALQLKQPTLPFRAAVFVTQGIFFNFFWVAYIVSPRFCHRLVGYLEEEAVKTYTTMLTAIDNGELKEWQTQRAPEIAIQYWSLPSNATVRDVIAVIRADEAHHRDVNHVFADLRSDQLSPFINKSNS